MNIGDAAASLLTSIDIDQIIMKPSIMFYKSKWVLKKRSLPYRATGYD